MKEQYERYVEAKKTWRAPMRDVSAIEVRAALANPRARFQYAQDRDMRFAATAARIVRGIVMRATWQNAREARP